MPKNLGNFKLNCSKQIPATILESPSIILDVESSKFLDKTDKGMAMAAMTTNAAATAIHAAVARAVWAWGKVTPGSRTLGPPRIKMVRYSPKMMDPSKNSRTKIVMTAKSSRDDDDDMVLVVKRVNGKVYGSW